jgi:hypothetical protein
MTKHLLQSLRQSFFKNMSKSKRPKRHHNYRKALSMESLESRQLLSITTLQNLSISGGTGEKPQSKVFEYAGQWWTVMPNSSGTSVFRLDGTSWTATQQISTTKFNTDIKLIGNVAHVLLFDGTSSQIASLQYDATDNRFEPWALRPQNVNVQLSSGVETATLEVDSTGRMWIASDVKNTVEVRYSDGLYTSWSAPITVASGIGSDDISAIIAMPNNQIGVFWSNQSTDRFGFRIHVDGAAPNAWGAPEVPAGQSALNVGGGMADDHVHLAVASDGTLYAAVKTSYDKSGYTKIALLVRRPNGVWDNLYAVDNNGTRPIVVLNEAAGKVVVAYTTNEGGGDIVYRESNLGTINFAPRKVLIKGSVNNVTSTKYTSNDEIVFIASSKSVLLSFDTGTTAPPQNLPLPPANAPPTVNAGSDRQTVLGTPVSLDGTVTDDALPTPAALNTLWTRVSGPTAGVVTFGNTVAVDTTANFTLAGTYVLRLTANDGQFPVSDDVTITVAAPPNPQTPPTGSPGPTEIAFQDGLFPYVTYAGTSDTKIAGRSANTNYGTAQTFDVDGDPDVAALLRWDIAAIPTGSIVVSAAIELNVTNSTKQNYEIYALQRAWDELSATWQRAAVGSNWGTAGAMSSADRDGAALGQLGPVSTGTQRIQLNAAGIAAVQAWIEDPSANFGIIVQDYTTTDGVDFRASETSNAAQRPKLIINYEPAPLINALAFAAFGNTAPLVNAGNDFTVARNHVVPLSGVVSDDGNPGDPSLLIVVWSKQSGPGVVTFGDEMSLDSTVQFSDAGTYVLRLLADDGELSAFDELTVTVL